jgi:hypothetical protein
VERVRRVGGVVCMFVLFAGVGEIVISVEID